MSVFLVCSHHCNSTTGLFNPSKSIFVHFCWTNKLSLKTVNFFGSLGNICVWQKTNSPLSAWSLHDPLFGASPHKLHSPPWTPQNATARWAITPPPDAKPSHRRSTPVPDKWDTPQNWEHPPPPTCHGPPPLLLEQHGEWLDFCGQRLSYIILYLAKICTPKRFVVGGGGRLAKGRESRRGCSSASGNQTKCQGRLVRFMRPHIREV